MNAAAEFTARLVASHASIGQVSRRRALPAERRPDFIEAEYATRLVAEVQQWRDALAPLLAELPSMLVSIRTDDTNEGRRARGVIEHARSVVRQTAADIQGVAPRIGRRVANHQAGQLARQTKAGLGVAVPTPDRAVPAKVEHFIAQNVAKIRSLGDRAMDTVERIVGESFTSRAPVEEVAAQIAKQLDVTESYARRLAAEQIAQLTAQLRQARHLELGVELFQWKTMVDPNVRDSHAVKHNKIFPYRGSRAPSFFPGEERGCRCRAVPVLDEIRVKAGIPIGRGRQRVA